MKVVTTASDQELVDRVRSGDDVAFRMLVERYQEKVAGVTIGMLGRTAEAEDVGQETFIRLYRSLKDFRGEASLGTYLSRIAINLSLTALKKRNRRNGEINVEDAGPELSRMGTSEEVERREARELIYLALEQLEPIFKSVILLRQIEGYSTKETAEILEIPSGTVLSRLQRGQAKLKIILQKMMDR